MALARCFFVAEPKQDLMKLTQLDAERLFPFNTASIKVYFNMQDASMEAKYVKQKENDTRDVPIFVLEVEGSYLLKLHQHCTYHCVKDTPLKSAEIETSKIKHVAGIQVIKSNWEEADFRFEKSFFKLGLKLDSKEHEKRWNEATGSFDDRMLALLSLYTNATFRLFGHHYLEHASDLRKKITERKSLETILAYVTEKLFSPNQNIQILDGSYSIVLRMLKMHIEDELERRKSLTLASGNNYTTAIPNPIDNYSGPAP